MFITIAATIFVLGVLILIHELGHFLAAKLFGIRVDRFSIGYPPRAFGFRRGETDYCISWLPLGGYVKLAGMIDESLDGTGISGEPWEFQSKGAFAKFVVISAGSLMNFFLAVVLFIMLSYLGGVIPNRVGGVADGSPAAAAGLQIGDTIIRVDNQRVRTWQDLTSAIAPHPGQSLYIEWERDGELLSADIIPQRVEEQFGDDVHVFGRIGIQSPKGEKLGIVESVEMGVYQFYSLTEKIITALKLLLSGQESVKSLGGPVVIAKLAGDYARSGVESLFGFMAFLSLNLGLLNLLPVPVLDGGHLVFILIEAVIRRPLPIKAKLVIQQVGMALLLALMGFIIYNDIIRVTS